MSSENQLTSKQICDIVRACGESRVLTIQYGPLHITFEKANETVVLEPSNIHYDLAQSSVLKPLDLNTTKQIQETDDSLDQLVIDDPADWERRMLEEDNG